MIRDPMGLRIGARWEEDLVWADGITDYQGSEAIIARLDDGRWLHYEWSYGSCSHCDSWETREQELAAEVAAGFSTMDTETFRDYLVACAAGGAEWVKKVQWPILKCAALLLETV